MNKILSAIPPIPVAAPDTTKVDDVNSMISSLSVMSVEDLISKIANGAVDLMMKIALAVVVFYIGKFIINRIYKLTKVIMIRREIDPSLSTFILSLLKLSLLFLLIVIVIGILGVETSSFIAIFASAGIAIGLALSGTLQNFAGGVLILLIKPYKVGDFVEVGEFLGTVKEIQIFNTVLNTPDNKSIIIPNGGLSTGSINNYSKEAYRRVDWNISIAYGDDYNKAKEVVLRLLADDERVIKKYIEDDENDSKRIDDATLSKHEDVSDEHESSKASLWNRMFHAKRIREKAEALKAARLIKEPKNKVKIDRSPFVALKTLADSSVIITIRAWTRTEHYWDVYFSINERIYSDFPKEGLHFPFPQLDVILKRDN